MARRSLRPQLNQIRTWVQQGRTDAWIAHQLEVTVQQITAFKRDNDLAPGESPDPANDVDPLEDEFSLRAQDDARIAEELEAAEAERLEEEAQAAVRKAEEDAARAARGDTDEDEADGDEDRPARRRGRRGGRGRRRGKSTGPYEGTFDHGEEGYGLWLDPGVADDATYAEHWAGHRAVEVVVEADQIVIRRVGDDAGPADED